MKINKEPTKIQHKNLQKYCAGCRNDYYNQDGNQCSLVADIELIEMYSIHVSTPMSGYKHAWKSIGKKPKCFRVVQFATITKEGYKKLL